MIDHLSTYTTHYDDAKGFYEAALAPLGYVLNTEMVTDWDPDWPTRRMCAFGPPGRSVFWIGEVKDPATPRHTAFHSKTREAVDAFHAAALARGGEDNGAPGPRPIYHEHYYGAFVFDPDGNNVEAVCHKPPD